MLLFQEHLTLLHPRTLRTSKEVVLAKTLQNKSSRILLAYDNDKCEDVCAILLLQLL